MKKHMVILVLIFASGCTIKKEIAHNTQNFTDKQLDMIMSASAEIPMRVLKINNKEDSLILRSDSSPVDVSKPNSDVEHFVNRLFSTVRDSLSMGVGIAAPQVGILKDIIWVQRFDKEGFPFEVYLNPVIKQYSNKKQDCREGCLSIPDRSDTTRTRAYAILLEYDKLDGTHVIEMIEDFTAVIFQHEIDHLQGILYLDRL